MCSVLKFWLDCGFVDWFDWCTFDCQRDYLRQIRALRDFVLVGPTVRGAYKCCPNLKAYRQGVGGSILILQLDRQSVSRPDWLANIYLIFLLEFLYFYFPTFYQTCSHKHLACPSTLYAFFMKFTEATQHIMMKSGPCARGLHVFSHHASRSSSVSLDVFSWLSADFALKNAWVTPTVAWSVDVQCDTCQLNIVSGLGPKIAYEKVAYILFAGLHGRLTNGYNI